MKTNTQEFPALFMTALIALASVCFTGCLRQLNATAAVPNRWSGSDQVQYYAPNYMTDQYQESKAPPKKLATRNS